MIVWCRQSAVRDLIRGRASGVTAKLRSLIGETAKHPDMDACLGRAQRCELFVRVFVCRGGGGGQQTQQRA